MTRRRAQRAKRSERGQALTEYALVMLFWVAALFVPSPLLRDPDGGQAISVLQLFLRAFDIYIDSFHTVIVLPIP